MVDAKNVAELRRPMRTRWAPVRIEPVQERAFLVARHHGLEAALQSHERLCRVRAAVDRIADLEEAVVVCVEFDFALRSRSGVHSARHPAVGFGRRAD